MVNTLKVDGLARIPGLTPENAAVDFQKSKFRRFRRPQQGLWGSIFFWCGFEFTQLAIVGTFEGTSTDFFFSFFLSDVFFSLIVGSRVRELWFFFWVILPRKSKPTRIKNRMARPRCWFKVKLSHSLRMSVMQLPTLWSHTTNLICYIYICILTFLSESKELELELEHSMNGESAERAWTLCKRAHNDTEIHLHRPTCRHADIWVFSNCLMMPLSRWCAVTVGSVACARTCPRVDGGWCSFVWQVFWHVAVVSRQSYPMCALWPGKVPQGTRTAWAEMQSSTFQRLSALHPMLMATRWSLSLTRRTVCTLPYSLSFDTIANPTFAKKRLHYKKIWCLLSFPAEPVSCLRMNVCMMSMDRAEQDASERSQHQQSLSPRGRVPEQTRRMTVKMAMPV